MLHPETNVVTPEHGPRPAGPSDKCFYCGEPIGALHAERCVMRTRTVLLRLTAEYAVAVPESWDAGQVLFHRGGSSWCADNAVEELRQLAEDRGCLCGLVRYEFVREATEEDEAALAPDSIGAQALP